MGIAVLSVVALVASGASPISAASADLTGVTDPHSVAFTASGDVLVTSVGGGSAASVAVFPGTATTPDASRTLTGVDVPYGIAVNRTTGDILVVSAGSGMVYTYRADQKVPDPSLTRTIAGAYDVEVDLDGEVYVSSLANNRVYVFPANSTVASRSFAAGTLPAGLGVHPKTGEIYVGSLATHRVQVYSDGSATPIAGRDLMGPAGNPLDPIGIAVHPASGRVYAVDGSDDLVMVFEPGASEPNSMLNMSTGWDTQDVAISPVTGAVYRTSVGADQVFVSAPTDMAVSTVAPPAGPVTGGTAVSITGANLGAVTGVSFGGVPATNVVAVSPTQVTAVAPAHAVGTVDVVVLWGSKVAGIANAFAYQAVAPGKASGVTGVPGNAQVTVSWTAPADSGGVPIASYQVTPTPAGPACATTATTCTIGGLTNGTAYTFTVRATNTAGLSSVSDPSSAVTPVIASRLKVKAKKASYRPARWGTRTLVTSVKKSSNARLVVTRSCTNGTWRSSSTLCKFTVYKSGKVKVRTKGYRNVRVTISIVAVPRASAGPVYGPSPTWTRTWRVK